MPNADRWLRDRSRVGNFVWRPLDFTGRSARRNEPVISRAVAPLIKFDFDSSFEVDPVRCYFDSILIRRIFGLIPTPEFQALLVRESRYRRFQCDRARLRLDRFDQNERMRSIFELRFAVRLFRPIDPQQNLKLRPCRYRKQSPLYRRFFRSWSRPWRYPATA